MSEQDIAEKVARLREEYPDLTDAEQEQYERYLRDGGFWVFRCTFAPSPHQ